MKAKTLKKTFFFTVVLLCAIFFTACSNVLTEPAVGAHALQRSARTRILSEMTEQECMEFIVQNGIKIPPMYANEPEFGAYVKNLIQNIELNPNYPVMFSYSVMVNFTENVISLVNAYYGQSRESAYPNTRDDPYELKYNKVKDIYGEWVTSGGDWDNSYYSYTCYFYAIEKPDFFSYFMVNMDPGFYSGSYYDYFSDGGSAYALAQSVKADLEYFWCTDVTITDIPPDPLTLGPNQKLISLRLGSDNAFPLIISDYHFMKYNAEDDSWYHKPGKSAPLKYLHEPADEIYDGGVLRDVWKSEHSIEGTEYLGDHTYFDDIYYIVYTEEFGAGTENDPFQITSTEQLLKVYEVDRQYKTIYFKLADNIDLLGETWEPFPEFYGVLFGNGKTISNLYINTNYNDGYYYYGLIGRNYGVIENLTITGSIHTNDSLVAAGFIAGVNDGTIYNVKAAGEIIVNQGENIGMIAGWNNGTIDTCTVSSNEDYMIYCPNDYSSSIGGVAGYNNFGVIQNCETNGDIYSVANNNSLIAGFNDNGTVLNNGGAGKLYSFGGGGKGTSALPYQISSKQHLEAVPSVDNSGVFFELLYDIDLLGNTWAPLPNFLGVFDGNNNTISGLYAEQPYGFDGG